MTTKHTYDNRMMMMRANSMCSTVNLTRRKIIEEQFLRIVFFQCVGCFCFAFLQSSNDKTVSERRTGVAMTTANRHAPRQSLDRSTIPRATWGRPTTTAMCAANRPRTYTNHHTQLARNVVEQTIQRYSDVFEIWYGYPNCLKIAGTITQWSWWIIVIIIIFLLKNFHIYLFLQIFYP